MYGDSVYIHKVREQTRFRVVTADRGPHLSVHLRAVSRLFLERFRARLVRSDLTALCLVFDAHALQPMLLYKAMGMWAAQHADFRLLLLLGE